MIGQTPDGDRRIRPMAARACKYCNNPLGAKKRPQAKFCNDSCRAAFHRGSVFKPKVNCGQCGKEIPQHRRVHAKFCSDKCRRLAWKERHDSSNS